MHRLRVKELAEARGHNMSSLSRASNVSFTTIKRYHHPTGDTNLSTLLKVAHALGCTISELVEWQEAHT